MKTLKINFNSQLRNWHLFSIHLSGYLLMMLFVYIRDGYNTALVIFVIAILIDLVFNLYVHITYYFKNKGQEFNLYPNKIVRIKNGKEEVFNTSDIDEIVICKSANMDSNWGIPYLTCESYRCARIYTKSNTFFIMTNLLEYDIEKSLSILENVKFERRKGFSFFI